MSKWKYDYIWQGYCYAKDGWSGKRMAEEFLISKEVLLRWKKKHPAFGRAIKAGKKMWVPPLKKINDETDLSEFIYGKLPEHLKETWDYIVTAYKVEGIIDIVNMDEEIKDETREARQVLFFHAWYRCNFSIVEARKLISVNSAEWEDWEADPVFTELFEKMDDIKSDFFESSLVNLVKKGHPATTQAANEAFNSEKYGRRSKVQHEGTIEHNHRHHHLVLIEELPLDIDTKKKVLAAMRQHKAIQEGETLELVG